LGEIPLPKWAVLSDVAFPPLRSSFKNSGMWQTEDVLPILLHNPDFLELAVQPPEDPHNIASYHGMLYARKTKLFNFEKLQKEYPGILFIDLPTHDYWQDKYKMSCLFKQNPQISYIKPEWDLYSKEYSPTLAEQIMADIPSEAYVIKPRGAFLGHGVIIVSADDLDATLKYILTDKSGRETNEDQSYSHWATDTFSSFIIEKYYPSDLLQVDEKWYEPSMRVSFILTYDNHKISIEFVGANWMLPYKAIDEEASLNERKKAYCKPPYFVRPSPEVVESVQQELREALPLLFKEMLNS
jgi:hypothetical protein